MSRFLIGHEENGKNSKKTTPTQKWPPFQKAILIENPLFSPCSEDIRRGGNVRQP